MIILWSLIVAFFCPTAQPDTNFRHLAEKDLKTSVIVHTQGIKAGRQVAYGCSGTYISAHEVLTAAHCFEGYEVTKVWLRGPNDPIGYRVRLVKLDPHHDLALLAAPFSHSYAKLGALPHVGDEVMNIGSPLIFEFAVSEGIVSILHYHILGAGESFMVTTAMINHGSSGGGAFNKKGQLIGVNTRSIGLFGWEGISLSVDVETIRRFLHA